MKIFILIFFVFIFIFSGVSANKIGISPSEIKIFGKPGEVICNNFNLIGNEIFVGEIKWNNNYTKNLKDYTINNIDLGIFIEYPKETKEGYKSLCISSEKEIYASGVLLYRVKNENYGTGTWIELNISDGYHSQKNLFLDGRVISDIPYQEIDFFDLLFILFCLIFISFIISIKFLFKQKD